MTGPVTFLVIFIALFAVALLAAWLAVPPRPLSLDEKKKRLLLWWWARGR